MGARVNPRGRASHIRVALLSIALAAVQLVAFADIAPAKPKLHVTSVASWPSGGPLTVSGKVRPSRAALRVRLQQRGSLAQWMSRTRPKRLARGGAFGIVLR